VRSQLTHESVQKSTRTTRPWSRSAVSGSELSQTGARSSCASAERVAAMLNATLTEAAGVENGAGRPRDVWGPHRAAPT